MSTYSSFFKKFFLTLTFQFPAFYFSKVTNPRSANIDDKSLHLDDDFLSFIEFLRTFIEIIFITYATTRNERWDFSRAGSSLFLPKFSGLMFLRFLGPFFIFSEIFAFFIFCVDFSYFFRY